jgi:hypothetical protein
MPLCLLPIKTPSDFSCGSKCCTKRYSFLTKSNQQLLSCRHTVIAGLHNFCCVNSLFYASLVLTANKACQISQRHEVSHKALLVCAGCQFSFVFPPRKLFFRTHIYQHGSGSVVKTVMLQAVAHTRRHQCITSILACFD